MNEARRPRVFAKINGVLAPVLSARTTENAHFQCDTFDITLEALKNEDFGLKYWGDAPGGATAEIVLGFLAEGDAEDAIPAELETLVMGEVDDVEVDPTSGIVSIFGRDLTGRLIDNKISETWPDRTASEIVTDLAGKAGLTPKVTKTKTPVGKYAKGQYAALGRDVPIWDLITSLAESEGFDAYVKGTTLYFGPSQEDEGEPLSIQVDKDGAILSANVENLRLKRAMTLAKDITVTVISYSAKKKVPIKAVARRQGAARSASTSFRTGKTAQNYLIRRPDLTQQQATDLAQKTLEDLSKHERTFSANRAADTTTHSRTKANISGTDTSWDTSYFIDTVTREFAFGELSMLITAKNHQIESQAVV